MRRLTFALALIASLCGGAGVQAQTYPSRPITLIVPYPPGGGVDAMGRMVAQKLSVALGQRCIFRHFRTPCAGRTCEALLTSAEALRERCSA